MDVKKLMALCAVSIFLSACGGGNDKVPNPSDGNGKNDPGQTDKDKDKKPEPEKPEKKDPVNVFAKPDPTLVKAINSIGAIKGGDMLVWYPGIPAADKASGGYLKTVQKSQVLPGNFANKALMVRDPSGKQQKQYQYMANGMYSSAHAIEGQVTNVDVGAEFLQVDKIYGLWTEPNSQQNNLSGIMKYKGKNTVIGKEPTEGGKTRAIFGDIEAVVNLTSADRSFEGKITRIGYLGSVTSDIDIGNKTKKGLSDQKVPGAPIAINGISEIELVKTDLKALTNNPVFAPNAKYAPKGKGDTFIGVGVNNGQAIAKTESGDILNDQLAYSVSMAGPRAEDVVGYVAVPVEKRGKKEPVLAFTANRYK